MIGGIEGAIVALRDDGFILKVGGSRNEVVFTLRPGKDMGLAIGDRVRVTGGPSPKGGWASSSVWRLNWDGSQVEAPQWGDGKLPSPPPKPWWRFW